MSLFEGLLSIEFVRELLLSVAKSVPSALMVLVPILLLYFRDRKKFKNGDMTDVVLMVSNYFEPTDDGRVLMKPRTVVASRPIAQVFPNPILAKAVAAAAKCSSTDNADDTFIDLALDVQQRTLGKKVVDNCSTLTAEGHLRRMHQLPVIHKESYACITLAREGDFKTIRIDLIAKDDLRKFLDPAYRRRLRARENEQSHDDMAAVFEICAREVFDPDDPSVTRQSNRAFRVSMQFVP
ncbi:hypothetical protein H6786_03330 [Candidatus Nomurabacteria bacterium]|nr:hypothetical protein [Candidatus Nomurabacteria bacterium]